MSSDIQTQALRRSPTTSAAQATPKRVRRSGTLNQLGSWWTLRYPTRAN